MVTFESAVTVYNKWTSGNMVSWSRTVLPVCSWYGGKGISFNGGSLTSLNGYSIRVREKDMPAGYLSPKEFRAQSAPSGWTLQQGDYLVKGEVHDEVAGGKITDIIRGFEEVCIVSKAHDNRRGVPSMRHIKITGE